MIASATDPTVSPSRWLMPARSIVSGALECRTRIVGLAAVDREHAPHPTRATVLRRREPGSHRRRDVSAQLVAVAAVDAVGDHEHAATVVGVGHAQ